VVDFEKDTPGTPPTGFTTALTGSGKAGVWVVVEDKTAPSGHLVLAQTDADTTSYRFPVCVLDAHMAKDAEISVKFKPVSGREDQGAGIVWRYRDKDNYYIVRANALEGNVVLYKVQNGKRTDLPLKGEGRTYGKKTPVPSGTWSTLGVNVRGSAFEVTLNGTRLYEVDDTRGRGPLAPRLQPAPRQAPVHAAALSPDPAGLGKQDTKRPSYQGRFAKLLLELVELMGIEPMTS